VWGITGTKPRPPDETRYEGFCPYRGLGAFGPDDARFFFGRAALTDWLVSDLRREIRSDQGVRFLGVLGPSGSGKSSVVMAGLVAQLRAGAIEGSERWPVAILRPGDDPLANLAVQVSSTFLPEGAIPDISQARRLIDDLQQEKRGLDLFAQLAMRDAPADSRLVIVVDQFEEVFTYRPLGDQARARFERSRSSFFANLLHAAAAEGGRVVVVLTMRSDFLGACATYPQLSSVLSAHQELVGPMATDELRAAIEQPSFLVGCEVEPALTERLLADVEGRPGALPLLQFALTEVWKKRDGHRLRLRSYDELGGIEGALEYRANEIYGALQPEDQELCRRIFLRLVEIGEGIENTRRRVSYNELLPVDTSKSDAINRLINTLSEPNVCLLTVNATNANDVTVEVVHEALIRSWTRLRQWIEFERVGLSIQRRLTADTQEWVEATPENKEAYLYSGARLSLLRDWIETHRDNVSSLESAFLAASEEAARRRKQEEVEKDRRLREAAEVAPGAQRDSGTPGTLQRPPSPSGYGNYDTGAWKELPPFRILSIDGGGIMGAFAASVLATFEREIGRKIVEHFDLITGTSTGGIIAIGLAMGVSPVSGGQELSHYRRAS